MDKMFMILSNIFADMRIIRKYSTSYVRFAQLGLLLIISSEVLKLKFYYIVNIPNIFVLICTCLFLIIIPILGIFYIIKLSYDVYKIEKKTFKQDKLNSHLLFYDILYLLLLFFYSVYIPITKSFGK